MIYFFSLSSLLLQALRSKGKESDYFHSISNLFTPNKKEIIEIMVLINDLSSWCITTPLLRHQFLPRDFTDNADSPQPHCTVERVKHAEAAATLANACGPNSCGAGRPTADHGVIYDADRRLRGAG